MSIRYTPSRLFKSASPSIPTFLAPALQTPSPPPPAPTSITSTSYGRYQRDSSARRTLASSSHRPKSNANAPSLQSKPSSPCGFASTSSRRDARTVRNDTIFALATGAGRAGVAIIRISGPDAAHIYRSFCFAPSSSSSTGSSSSFKDDAKKRLDAASRRTLPLPPARKLILRDIHHPCTGELLDAGAGVIYFPHGASYTGEESLELHVHGGLATISDVLSALGDRHSSAGEKAREAGGRVRMAEPGEFTRRAFENGRLDLSSAEGLHELISAETSVQRKVALQGANGLQCQRYEQIRSELVTAMTMVEALIDFSDEDGVEDGAWNAAVRFVQRLGDLLRSELGLAPDDTTKSSSPGMDGDGEPVDGGRKQVRHVGEILTTGIRLAIYGPPNAGKSSLLNRLADRKAAIVSDIPGTTRDVLQVHLDLAGYKVIVYDTAGIRDQLSTDKTNNDEIERIGMERAKEVVKAADLSLLVLPATDANMVNIGNAETNRAFEVIRPDSYTSSDPDLIFFNKADLLPSASSSSSSSSSSSADAAINSSNSSTSSKIFTGSVLTDQGISDLISSLASHISAKYSLASFETPLITQSRHRFHLNQCLHHITNFISLATPQQQPQQLQEHEGEVDLVVAAEELRYAAKAVGKITGRDVSPDEVLGSIFSTFCIGK